MSIVENVPALGRREVWDESGEVLLHRGVRVSMGCAYGRGEKEFFRKPLSSGRPDYFGWLPNLAARILGQARPGQVVVEVRGSVASLSGGVGPKLFGINKCVKIEQVYEQVGDLAVKRVQAW